MKLAEKGRFQPPPVITGPFAQTVSETVGAWPDVHARTHWLLGDEQKVDGADFYVGEEELGHIHLYAEAHVLQQLPLAEALVEAKLALPFRWSRNVVVFGINALPDIDHALWLFRLNYDYLKGTSVSDLLARVRGYSEARAAGKKPSSGMVSSGRSVS